MKKPFWVVQDYLNSKDLLADIAKAQLLHFLYSHGKCMQRVVIMERQGHHQSHCSEDPGLTPSFTLSLC